MLSGNVFYHGIIRKCVVAFGFLFSNIYIDRKKDGSVTGTTVQRLQIPIAYGPKEKWLVRLEQDPDLDNHTYISLPRIAYEVTGYSFDSSRKLNKNNTITCNSASGSASVFTPVPYNIEISMFILTKTQEDAMQIIEQILPTFGPEYTMAIKVTTMNIVQDIPITLDSVSIQDEYEGDFQTRRFVIHTLTFTLKTQLYGPLANNTPIYDVTANISFNEDLSDPARVYNALGDETTYEITLDEWSDG